MVVQACVVEVYVYATHTTCVAIQEFKNKGRSLSKTAQERQKYTYVDVYFLGVYFLRVVIF